MIDQVAVTGALAATAIVTNPRTGEIYALANVAAPLGEDGLPTGEPAVPTGANLALTSVFEPGSVNKVITVAGAIEEGLVSPTTPMTVPDRLQVSDHLFTDHDPHADGDLDADRHPGDVVEHRHDPARPAARRDRIDEYLRRFGFGEQTALDFPGESAGLLLDPEDWSGTSIGSIPLGQGIAVTAMQMLAAYNVIANDGVYVEPRLVQATRRRRRRPP